VSSAYDAVQCDKLKVSEQQQPRATSATRHGLYHKRHIEKRAHSIGRSFHSKTRLGSSVAFCVCYSESLKFYMRVLQFSLRALFYNCYKSDQQNAHTSMLQLIMLPNCYMFQPSPAHHQLLQLYKQSLDHTVICSIRHCGDIISV
jgi:hypothetical protein